MIFDDFVLVGGGMDFDDNLDVELGLNDFNEVGFEFEILFGIKGESMGVLFFDLLKIKLKEV